VYSVEFDPFRSRLLAGSQTGYFYAIQDGVARKIEAHKGGLFSILVKENQIITAGGDGFLQVWSPELKILHSLRLSNKSVRRIISIPGGFAASGSEGIVWLLSPELKIVDSWQDHQSSVFSLEFITAGNNLISGGRDAVIRSRVLGEVNEHGDIAAHLLHIHDLKLSPAGSLLASASMDKTIKIWKPHTIELLKVLDAARYGIHTSSVNSLVWLSESMLVSASDDKNLGVWGIGGD
jgi:WD40 repeat protein